MKAAVLIVVHDQPAHLSRLITFLDCEWMHIFIHVDKKIDIAEFKKNTSIYKNVTFLDGKNRVKVNWGGFSTVIAILNLLHASLSFEENFDRFILLSGSDFPIKKLSDIKVKLESETEFMRIDRRLGNFDHNSHCRLVRHRFFSDIKMPKRVRICLESLPRKVYKKITLYHGSVWWALTRESVKYIMKFIDNNRDYVTFHRQTLCSDEIFFHSIVKNSSFANNLSHDFERATDMGMFSSSNEHGCHYINWNDKTTSLPKILNESDFYKLLNSQCFFARKFRETDSKELLLKLETMLLK